MSNIKNKKTKTSIHPGYQTLLNEVLPRLEMYQNDILVYDKKTLIGYEGRFISAYRSTGTNIFLLDDFTFVANKGKKGHRTSTIQCCENEILFLSMNQNFLLVTSDGTSETITMEQAKALLLEQKTKALDVVKNIEAMNFEQMALELKWFIFQNGRAWKSTLREQWQENRATPALTRMRNRFEDQFLLRFNLESSEEESRKELVSSYVRG